MACLHQVEQFVEAVKVSGQGLGDGPSHLPFLKRVPDPRVGLGMTDNGIDLDSQLAGVVEEIKESPAGAVVGPIGVSGIGLAPAELRCRLQQSGEVVLVLQGALASLLQDAMSLSLS
jgi:hypothetical protein